MKTIKFHLIASRMFSEIIIVDMADLLSWGARSIKSWKFRLKMIQKILVLHLRRIELED